MHSAVHALVALGLVRVHHGVGTFVARPSDGSVLLGQAYRHASVGELVAMRSMVDERLAITAAQRVARAWRRRVPAMLDLIGLYAHERAAVRHSYPQDFLRADARVHRTLGASVHGYEIAAVLRDEVDARLHDAFLPVADVLAADEELQEGHVRLATAVMDGRPIEAGRLARRIADREAAALGKILG